MPKLHRNFNDFAKNSGRHVVLITRKATYLREKCVFSTVLAHRHRWPPFHNPIFNSFTHHPGLAGIINKRNCLTQPSISRKSVCGTPLRSGISVRLSSTAVWATVCERLGNNKNCCFDRYKKKSPCSHRIVDDYQWQCYSFLLAKT